MNSTRRILLGISTAVLIATTSLAHAAANPDPPDLDADILAKIAKERSKKSVMSQGAPSAAQPGQKSDVPCGAVDIGNVNTGGRIGMTPPQVTVVVVGDVISANNVCK